MRASRRSRPAADELFNPAEPDRHAVGQSRNRSLPGRIRRSLRRAVFVHFVVGRRRRPYVKNQGLGFTIPYTIAGQQHAYLSDFIARFDDGRGDDDLLNLILEVSGKRDKEKEANVATARTLWVPAVNNAGTWGRWAFLEIGDPWDAKNTIRGQFSTKGV